MQDLSERFCRRYWQVLDQAMNLGFDGKQLALVKPGACCSKASSPA